MDLTLSLSAKKLPSEEENLYLGMSDDNFLMEGSCIKVVPPWGRCRWQKVLMAPNAPTPTESSQHFGFSKKYNWRDREIYKQYTWNQIFVLKAQMSRMEWGIKSKDHI